MTFEKALSHQELFELGHRQFVFTADIDTTHEDEIGADLASLFESRHTFRRHFVRNRVGA